MSEMFDFGNGPVPARRHKNGGGWVADTATVSDSAYVGQDAQVSGNARVGDDALVSGSARVSGNALVYGNAQVYDDARVFGNAQVSGSAQVYGNALVNRGEYAEAPITISRSDGYAFTLQADGGVIAGCRDFTREQALAHWGNPNHHKHAESMAILTALYAIAEARK